MKQQKWNRLFQGIFIVLGMSVGYYVLPYVWDLANQADNSLNQPIVNTAIGALIFILIIIFLRPWQSRMIARFEKSIRTLSIANLSIGIIGLIIGLFLAWLINIPLQMLEWPIISNILPIIITAILGFTGYYIAQLRAEEVKRFFERFSLKRSDVEKADTLELSKVVETKNESALSALNSTQAKLTTDFKFQPFKILDTSVIIDGRIVDVLKTGFIEGIIVVPNFVLQELQYIADAADSVKRVRGRRGLDVLNQIQEIPNVAVKFFDGDYADTPEVDLKLLRLAKDIDGIVVTNDYNLNKVSQFHKIKVLNVNELAGSLKIVVIPGEVLVVHIIKPGTERQQGVAYLDDGTMIVVEDGKNHLDETLQVEVTSAIQTNAGRMIFAKIV